MAAWAPISHYRLGMPLVQTPSSFTFIRRLHSHLNSSRKESSIHRDKKIKLVSRRISAAVIEKNSPAHFSASATAKLLAVVDENTPGGLKSATWHEVMKHMVNRLRWVDDGFELRVVTVTEFQGNISYKETFAETQILIVIGIRDGETVKLLLEQAENVPTKVCFDSAPELETWLGGVKVIPLNPVETMAAAFPGSKVAKGLRVLELITDAWSRQSSDNICYMLLVLIDSYASPVKLLKNLRATSLSSIACMTKNCGREILACLLDPTCRKALNCLTSCAANDQVCSYRCIVSYETEALQAFTLCALQKHNCLGLSAEIQMQPDVQPMQSFRGQALTHSLAEDLFVGWLGKLDWSWRVVAGQNAAYDHFPNQYQIFYRGKASGTVWYDPVFQVKTLEGELVWRRRHYRVRRADKPGSFYFTVLDNGVISKEFWRIVHVADDLSWGLFYYSGAAEAAGQSYTGAILVSPDGFWPSRSESEGVNRALELCGIKVWELYSVNNTEFCKEGMPLGLPPGSRLHYNIHV